VRPDPTAADLDREIAPGASSTPSDLIMTQPIYTPRSERFMDRATAFWRPAAATGAAGRTLHSSRHAEFLHHEVPGITTRRRCGAMAAAGERADVGAERAGARGRMRLVAGTYLMPSLAAMSTRRTVRARAPTPPPIRSQPADAVRRGR
jgi:hypothetical protein